MKHVVGIAEMKLSNCRDDLIVTHGLGSCLGIAAYDPGAAVAALLHVMMPQSSTNPEKARHNPCMFMDTAIPALFSTLEAAGARKSRCRVKVAGGAVLSSNDHFEIGKKNYIALKKAFWKSGILIESEDVGGNCARTMYVEVGTGRVWLSKNGQEFEL